METHMAFKRENNFLLCKKVDGIWKLHYIEKLHIKQVNTGLPLDATECCPTFFVREDGLIQVSFVVGGNLNEQNRHSSFGIYIMAGKTLDTLSKATLSIKSTKVGFVNEKYSAYFRQPYLVVKNLKTGAENRLGIPTGYYFYRVSYVAMDLNKLIISFGKSGLSTTVIYDIQTKTEAQVTCDGRDAYKLTIDDDLYVYSRKKGIGFEDRILKYASKTELTPTKHITWIGRGRCKTCGSSKLVYNEGCDVLRPSCFECTEKHWFSAWKMMCEIQDGYDFRRRVIGELFQAEDESGAWKELHLFIRNARKEYQQKGIIPNWKESDKLMDEIYQQIKLDNKGIEMVLSSQHESGA